MRLYKHRINTIPDLERVPEDMGIEFDLRSSGNDVLITHDPFTEGPTIEEFFPRIGKRPCIFNVKCEGIEDRVRTLAKQHGIEEYFFLDCSVPAAMKLKRLGEKRIAVRYSEVEPIEGVLAWRGSADWVWVDCFTRFPIEEPAWSSLTSDFRICLVSPELQGHKDFDSLRAQVRDRTYHAVCTKTPERWS